MRVNAPLDSTCRLLFLSSSFNVICEGGETRREDVSCGNAGLKDGTHTGMPDKNNTIAIEPLSKALISFKLLSLSHLNYFL